MFARKTPPQSKPSPPHTRLVKPGKLEDAVDRGHLEKARDEYERGEMETISLEELLGQREP